LERDETSPLAFAVARRFFRAEMRLSSAGGFRSDFSALGGWPGFFALALTDRGADRSDLADGEGFFVRVLVFLARGLGGAFFPGGCPTEAKDGIGGAPTLVSSAGVCGDFGGSPGTCGPLGETSDDIGPAAGGSAVASSGEGAASGGAFEDFDGASARRSDSGATLAVSKICARRWPVGPFAARLVAVGRARNSTSITGSARAVMAGG
jgi:hypothetical protein